MRGQVVSLPQSHSTMEYSLHGGGGDGWGGKRKGRVWTWGGWGFVAGTAADVQMSICRCTYGQSSTSKGPGIPPNQRY